MKPARRLDAAADLKSLLVRGSLLDVSCGHGDVLEDAADMGFSLVRGTEIIPELIDGQRVVYAEVHSLPFDASSFEVVSMFDVIEHLLPGDDERACKELARVASKHILITANNRPSVNHIGEDLHINKRPYEEWDALFRDWFGGTVHWLRENRKDQGQYASSAWRVDL
jgi:SAM-dependent methyltransferase